MRAELVIISIHNYKSITYKQVNCALTWRHKIQTTIEILSQTDILSHTTGTKLTLAGTDFIKGTKPPVDREDQSTTNSLLFLICLSSTQIQSLHWFYFAPPCAINQWSWKRRQLRRDIAALKKIEMDEICRSLLALVEEEQSGKT